MGEWNRSCQPPPLCGQCPPQGTRASQAGRRLQGGGVRGALGKAQGHQVHSTVARSSEPERPWVRKEVSRIQNRSVFWEVKLGAGDTQPEEDLGLLGWRCQGSGSSPASSAWAG